MTAAAKTEAPAVVPPADTVLFWLTYTIEQDYERRAVFPALRSANAHARRGVSSLHYLTPSQADEILEDATARHLVTGGGVRNAFRGAAQSLRDAIAEAATRPQLFVAPFCTYRSDYRERWIGTKAGIATLGITNGSRPWPREPGGGKWFRAKDARGNAAAVSSYCSSIWPDVFEVRIDITRATVKAPEQDQERKKEAEQARRSLADMFLDAEDFRTYLIGTLRSYAGIIIGHTTTATKWHAFTLTEDSAQNVLASFDAITEAIVEAEVVFDAPRHEVIAQGHRAQIAAGDPAFQAQLAGLARLQPELIEGERS